MDVQSDFSEAALCIQPENQRGLIGCIQLHSWLPVRPAGKWVSAFFFPPLSLSLSFAPHLIRQCVHFSFGYLFVEWRIRGLSQRLIRSYAGWFLFPAPAPYAQSSPIKRAIPALKTGFK